MPVRFRLVALLLLSALARPAAAQTVVRTVPVEGARDLVAVGDRLVVGVGGTYTAADGLVVIDPATGTVADRVSVFGGAARLALSDDGATLYAGLATTPSVARFATGPLREVSRFSLGSEPGYGARYANDLAIDPDDPGVVVVTRRSQSSTPAVRGAAVFDDGVQRPETFDEAIVLARAANGQLFSYLGRSSPGVDPNSESGPLARLTVTPDGLVGQPLLVDSEGNPLGPTPLLGAPTADIDVSDTTLYGSNGSVVDIETDRSADPLTEALWSGSEDIVEYVTVRVLPDLGRVALLARIEDATYLVVFDAASGTPLGVVLVAGEGPVRDYDRAPRRLERWGDRGMAYVTDGAVVLIETALLAESFGFAAFEPRALDLGTIVRITERAVAVRNTGTAPLRVDAVVGSVPELSFEPAAFTLAPGEALEGTLRVAPADSGVIAGTLTFHGDGAGSSSLTVTATVDPTRLRYFARTVDFGAVGVGETFTVRNVVFNNNVRPVQVTGVRTTNPRFVLPPLSASTTPPFTIDPRGNNIFDIAFRPDAVGVVEAALIVENDAFFGADTLRLVGQGAPATAGEAETDLETGLGVPFPNPARVGARIPVTVATGGPVRVALYDALGREVAVVLDAPLAAGRRMVSLQLADRPPGVHLVRMEVDGEAYTRRIAVTR